MKQRLAVRRQRVEPSGDQRLDRVGHADVSVDELASVADHTLVGEHADELLGVERIAAGLFQEPLLCLGR